jgi:hypothetical protein
MAGWAMTKTKKQLEVDNTYVRNIIETQLKPDVRTIGQNFAFSYLICPICKAQTMVTDEEHPNHDPPKWRTTEPLKHKKHCYYAGREHTLP